MNVIRNRGSEWFLVLLLCTDTIFIMLHLLLLVHSLTGIPVDSHFSITLDRGFPEVFQYVKEYWIILVFVFLALTKFSYCYLAWGLLFGYLLLDDMLEIHERVGMELSHYFTLPSLFGLRPEDLGELMVLVSVGSILFVAIGIGTYISDWKIRRFSGSVALILLVLIFFGVVVDLIHIMFQGVGWRNVMGYLLGTIEEGGEMVTMSVMAWFVFTALSNQSPGNKEGPTETTLK